MGNNQLSDELTEHKKATTHDVGNPGPGLRPAQKCGGVKSVCFVVWWLTLCTINSIRNKCKTCVIFFHTLVFVRQNNAMSYNIFSFKLFKINYTNNRKHAIFILGNHFFGAFKLFLILMANVIINYKHYCWH
jgi:hypothetical protein